MNLSFVVYGTPHAQERSGNQIVRGKDGGLSVHHYDKPKSAAFKQEIKTAAMALIMKRNFHAYPVANCEAILTVKSFRSIPKSWSKKKTEAAARGEILPISKPDLKNYIWGVEDALNGIAWKDDGQVVSFGESGKFYTDGIPRIEVDIEFKEVTT